MIRGFDCSCDIYRIRSVKEEEAHLLATMSCLGFSASEYDATLAKIRKKSTKIGSMYLDTLQVFRLKLMRTGSIEKALEI